MKKGYTFDMYIKKLVKVSRSYYALIPSIILQLLGIDPKEDKIAISLEGKKIIIEKVEKK